MSNKQKNPDMYLNKFQVPIYKDKINLIFTRRGTLHAITEMGLLEDFARSFHESSVDEARNYLKDSNAMVVKIDTYRLIILPFDVTDGVMAHEIYHLANMIMHYRGVQFCNASEEAFAYLIDWLTEKIMPYRKALEMRLAKEKKRRKRGKVN